MPSTRILDMVKPALNLALMYSQNDAVGSFDVNLKKCLFQPIISTHSYSKINFNNRFLGHLSKVCEPCPPAATCVNGTMSECPFDQLCNFPGLDQSFEGRVF